MYMAATKPKDFCKVMYAVTLLISGKLCQINLTHLLFSLCEGKRCSEKDSQKGLKQPQTIQTEGA